MSDESDEDYTDEGASAGVGFRNGPNGEQVGMSLAAVAGGDCRRDDDDPHEPAVPVITPPGTSASVPLCGALQPVSNVATGTDEGKHSVQAEQVEMAAALLTCGCVSVCDTV